VRPQGANQKRKRRVMDAGRSVYPIFWITKKRNEGGLKKGKRPGGGGGGGRGGASVRRLGETEKADKQEKKQ